ncbi:MAG: archease [candidate division Zixibacteria bacterium]
MNETGFRIIEELPSADFIFDAFGENLEELFSNCAKACFFAMTDSDGVEPSSDFHFEVEGETSDDLLYSFISELIFLKDSESIFLSEFDIEIDKAGKSLKAVVRGEKIDYNKHVIKTDVKAATYHDLHIRDDNGRFMVRMILDL